MWTQIVLLTFCWTFAFMSLTIFGSVIKYLYGFLNCLQGSFLFIFFVLINEEVKKYLKERRKKKKLKLKEFHDMVNKNQQNFDEDDEDEEEEDEDDDEFLEDNKTQSDSTPQENNQNELNESHNNTPTRNDGQRSPGDLTENDFLNNFSSAIIKSHVNIFCSFSHKLN